MIRGGSSKCKANDTEVFSQLSFAEIPKNRHIRLATIDETTGRVFYNCFDVVSLGEWAVQHGTNPLTREPLTDSQKAKIRKKLRKLEQELEETENKTLRRKGQSTYIQYSTERPSWYYQD